MTGIFWFTLVVGGGLLLFSILGDIFGSDIGEMGDTPELGDAGDLGSGGTDSLLAIFSLRNLTYAFFGFGLTGVVLEYLWGDARPLVTSLAAICGGLLAAWLNSLILGYVRRTESGTLRGDSELVGLPGMITLPFGPGGSGKIEVVRSGRMHELLARPFGTPQSDPTGWGEVVIVAIEDGVALVAPLEAGTALEAATAPESDTEPVDRDRT